ncbi:MAG: tetratricopeptide repeat protein [Spirochaetales bacterium]|nr:tetratricopeptide repeat protein [Spirochaetales bacterium]
MTPSRARSIFYNTGDLIIRNNKVWLPFEVTMVQNNFIKAWQEGAREWRRYEPLNKAGFFPVAEAWRVYEPVGLPGNASNIEFPATEKIRTAFSKDINRVVQREIVNKVKALENRIAKSGNNAKLINKLGILYARYSLYSDAEVQFFRILKKPKYRSIALVNIGNIRFKKGDFKGALKYYEQARGDLPDNSRLLLNIARVRYQLGEYGKSQVLYEQVAIVSPELAKGYEYLGTKDEGTSRAASAEERGNVLWQE